MRTFRFQRNGLKSFGYENWFAQYGRNAKNNYRIEAKMDLGILSDEYWLIYQGKRKPFIRNPNLLTALLLPLTPLFFLSIPILLLAYCVNLYFVGAYKFVKNEYHEGISVFNWSNIVIIIVLVVCLLFNCA